MLCEQQNNSFHAVRFEPTFAATIACLQDLHSVLMQCLFILTIRCSFLLTVQNVDACDAMNGCVICLAKAHRHVKFCKITAADARLSTHFVSHFYYNFKHHHHDDVFFSSYCTIERL